MEKNYRKPNNNTSTSLTWRGGDLVAKGDYVLVANNLNFENFGHFLNIWIKKLSYTKYTFFSCKLYFWV